MNAKSGSKSPNYSQYSKNELLEALNSVDSQKYPDRHLAIRQNLERLEKLDTRHEEVNKEDYFDVVQEVNKITKSPIMIFAGFILFIVALYFHLRDL